MSILHWLSMIPLRLRSLFRRSWVERELDDEMRDHLQSKTQLYIAQGLAPEEARGQALRDFGGVELSKEQCRDTRGVSLLEDFLQDLRFGGRTLRKSPGFAAVAILTLALGIGANTAIFSVIDAALLRALPVNDPQSLFVLHWDAQKAPDHLSYDTDGDCDSDFEEHPHGCSFSQPFSEILAAQSNVFSQFAAFAGTPRIDFSGAGLTPFTADDGKAVSGSYFQILGIRAAAGRLIGPEDDTASAPAVVVLGHTFWKTHFGGDPSVIGRSVLLNGAAFAVVGVAEPRFDALSPGNSIDLWLPLSALRQIDHRWDNRQIDDHSWWLVTLARLQPGVSRQAAVAGVSAIFQTETLHSARPIWNAEAHPTLRLAPAQQELSGTNGEIEPILYVLLLAVAIVLLIACGNVAGLLLSRATARHREIAVRLALGARPSRILRQLLTESLMLSIAGGALGTLLAYWGISAMMMFVAQNTDGSTTVQPHLSLRVLGFTAGIALVTGFVFGIAPALRSLRFDLIPALKEAGGTSFLARTRRLNAGSVLVVGQVALSIVVLVAAGLLVRTLQNLKTVDPGFDTRNVLLFRAEPALIGYKSDQADAFFRNLHQRLKALPGIISVAYSYRPLLSGNLRSTSFSLPGAPADQKVRSDLLPVGPGFLETMRIPFVIGGDFRPSDFDQARRVDEALQAQRDRVNAHPGSADKSLVDENHKVSANLPPMPALVNQKFLQRFFPGREPIGIQYGRHVPDLMDPVGNPGWQIVGVVGNAKYNNLRREIQPTFYVPTTGNEMSFALRAAGNPEVLVPQIHSLAAELDSNIPIFHVITIREQVERQLFPERIVARLSSYFGLLALGLACVGLYGLLAYEVSRRTREIGIRIAMGAARKDVLALVIVRGAALALAGALVGVAIAVGVTRFLRTMLYNVRPADPITIAGVSLLLLAVGVLSCYVPARRALRVHPVEALRYE
jgi:predicted permease